MSWLVRFEAFPHLFDNSLLGYQDAVKNLPQLMDSWMMVLSDGKHVGYSYSSVDREDDSTFSGMRLQSVFFLQLSAAERIENFRLTSTVLLDERQELQEFEFSGTFSGMSGRVEGHRLEGEDYEVVMSVQDQELRRGRMAVPADALLYMPTMESVFRRLKEGSTLRIRTLDPLTGRKHDLLLRGMEDTELILHTDETPKPVRHVQMEMNELILNAWIDDRGRVLRQETPFPGLILEHAVSSDAISSATIEPFDLSLLLKGGQAPSFLNLLGTP